MNKIYMNKIYLVFNLDTTTLCTPNKSNGYYAYLGYLFQRAVKMKKEPD